MTIPESIEVNVVTSVFSNATSRTRDAKLLCITLHENDYNDVNSDRFNTRIKLDKVGTAAEINNNALIEYLTEEETITEHGLIAFNEITNTLYFTVYPTTLPNSFVNFEIRLIAYGKCYQCMISDVVLTNLIASMSIGNKAILTFTKVN